MCGTAGSARDLDSLDWNAPVPYIALMLRFALLLFVSCLAAACVMTPAEIQQSGPPTEFDGVQVPSKAAACMGRNAEAYLGGLSAQWRESTAPGSYEVLVRSSEHLHAVAEVTPSGAGSRIRIWLTPYFMRRELPAAMAQGC